MKTIEEATNEIRSLLLQTGEQIRKDSKVWGARFARKASAVVCGFARAFCTALGARRLQLLVLELVGVVLIAFGISLWSIPAALIVGGLVLVGVVEMRPNPGPKFPKLPLPEEVLRQQAGQAAIIINAERFGIGQVDPVYLEKLSTIECENLIILARTLVGVKKT